MSEANIPNRLTQLSKSLAVYEVKGVRFVAAVGTGMWMQLEPLKMQVPDTPIQFTLRAFINEDSCGTVYPLDGGDSFILAAFMIDHFQKVTVLEYGTTLAVLRRSSTMNLNPA